MAIQKMRIDGNKEKRRLELQVFAPIHIGSKEGRLTALEFIRDSKKVYLIDEQKFARFLYEKKLIDHFIEEVKKGPVRLESFLREKARFKIPEDLSKITGGILLGGGDGMQDFRPFIRDGYGSIYLPGSSIKGVFRTALLYKMITSDSNLKENLISQINREKDLKRKKKFFSTELLQKGQLQKFWLPGSKEGPHQDLFRCFTIRDAYPVSPIRNEIIQIHFLSKAKDGHFYWSQDKKSSGKDLAIWVEAVLSGKFETEIFWHKELFEQFEKNNRGKPFPIRSVDDLLDSIEAMNRDLFEEERKFFEGSAVTKPTGVNYKEILRSIGKGKEAGAIEAASSLKRFYQERPDGLFRIGFGSGMLSNTVNLSLPPSLRQKIRDTCGSGERPGDPAPKSRRVWRRGSDGCLPLGWLTVKSSH